MPLHPRRVHVAGVTFAALCVALGLALGGGTLVGSSTGSALRRAVAPARASTNAGGITGLGRATSARIPARTGEVVLVEGDGRHRSTSELSLWARAGRGWREVGRSVRARNGAAGWSAHRRADDLTSPVGVFSLTSAGGALPNPGTRLPYEYDPAYFARSRYLGDRAVGVFDYVVAIDFNRLRGAPVSSGAEPDGAAEGGGIWLHIGDGRPSAGCVTVARAEMVRILRWLTPGARPVIVMGARSTLDPVGRAGPTSVAARARPRRPVRSPARASRA